MTIEKLKKRDGRLVSFDKEKIARAIAKAFEATYKPGQNEVAETLSDEVLSILEVEGIAEPEEDKHLVELFGTLAAVFEHGTHGGIAVNVSKNSRNGMGG